MLCWLIYVAPGGSSSKHGHTNATESRSNERREEWLTIIVYVLALKERKKKEEIG